MSVSCLSLRENKEWKAFWIDRNEHTGQSVPYNDEAAKNSLLHRIRLKGFSQSAVSFQHNSVNGTCERGCTNREKGRKVVFKTTFEKIK